MILTAQVRHMHRMIRIKEVPSYLDISICICTHTKTILLLSSHSASCLCGCVSRNRKHLELTHPFIQKTYTIKSFHRKE